MNKQPEARAASRQLLAGPSPRLAAGDKTQRSLWLQSTHHEAPQKSPSTMPTTTSLKHLPSPAAWGAGLALVLSAASSKGTGKGQLYMKGTEP